MIDLEFLQSLIRAIDESSIDSVEIERGGTRVRVSKTPPQGSVPATAPMAMLAPAPAASSPPPAPPQESAAPAAPSAEEAAPAADSNLVEIRSPMVGTFYRSPAPDADPYVEVGSTVGPGDTLCIIEAMKLMNELEGEVAGVIREVCVDNAEPVEYGQVLFRLEQA
jgi:acetyl-CoA carboxylase biotin carboxyl carrier protein